MTCHWKSTPALFVLFTAGVLAASLFAPDAAAESTTLDTQSTQVTHNQSEAELRVLHQVHDEAWRAFIDGLEDARQALISSKHFAPPLQDSRVSAEGYRYLLGHLERMIEMELRLDPKFPEFHASINMLRKWTIENPDTMYLKAPIDSTGFYKVIAKVANHEEWQTSKRGVAGPKAPRLLTFQTITEVPGNTGSLAEMADCTNQTLDFVNSFALQLDKDGSFELLIGPEKPEGHKGNFLLSKKRLLCPGTKKTQDQHAKWLAVREIFSDWQHEMALDMEIQRLDSIGAARPPLSSADVNRALSNIGKHMPNQIKFWNLLHLMPLEVYGDTNNDGRRNMPLNGINPPAPPFTAGGVAGSQQIYAAGNYELADDEALLVKVSAEIEPHYVSFQLGTAWGEGPDQQNYISSLTGHQNPISSDGARYYIIAHQDPGFQGWVDTTGTHKGTHSMRFVFRDQPQANQLPIAEAQLVKFSALAEHLPKNHPKVTAKQRTAEVAIRQAHIKRRWRGH
ncbi:MAG: hypothetical protein AB8B86_07165 [Pseudomonadales bacterium]